MSDSQFSKYVLTGLLGVAAVAAVGVTVYYLSREDEFEEFKHDLKKLGKAMGGFDKLGMYSYIDHGQLCQIFEVVKK